MGRALMVRVGVGRTFWKRAANLDRLPSAWLALRLFDPTAAPQLLLDALHKLLPRAKLALLPRHTESEMYYVEATCGYPSDDLSWVQFTQDSPLIRHLVAHPVTTRRDQLERLPWFPFLPDPDREAMAALGPIVIEPISNERGLADLLVLGRRSTGQAGNLETVHRQWTWAGLSDADRARLAAIFEGWEPNQRRRPVQPRPGLALPLPGEMNRAIYPNRRPGAWPMT